MSEIFFRTLLIVIAVIFGWAIGHNRYAPADDTLKKAKIECEKDLPRSQSCVLNWKYAPQENSNATKEHDND